jgi:hypothetical protein
MLRGYVVVSHHDSRYEEDLQFESGTWDDEYRDETDNRIDEIKELPTTV